MKYWRKSCYGCKYRIEFSPKHTRGVQLNFIDRLKIFLGADLMIVHHYKGK